MEENVSAMRTKVVLLAPREELAWLAISDSTLLLLTAQSLQPELTASVWGARTNHEPKALRSTNMYALIPSHFHYSQAKEPPG